VIAAVGGPERQQQQQQQLGEGEEPRLLLLLGRSGEGIIAAHRKPASFVKYR
tara:strand:- start:241 stop:396 length:156 start_codon:yes stop_codon:yes gene_type:complete